MPPVPGSIPPGYLGQDEGHRTGRTGTATGLLFPQEIPRKKRKSGKARALATGAITVPDDEMKCEVAGYDAQGNVLCHYAVRERPPATRGPSERQQGVRAGPRVSSLWGRSGLRPLPGPAALASPRLCRCCKVYAAR